VPQVIRDEVIEKLLQDYGWPQDLRGEEGCSKNSRSGCCNTPAPPAARSEDIMRILTLILWVCSIAVQAMAAPSPCAVCGAPAPLIGLGIPAALGIGAVLLGAKLLKRRR
jgi:hypothetical protein